MQWYCKRGDASENRIKDLKIGFGMEYMPCGTTINLKALSVLFMQWIVSAISPSRNVFQSLSGMPAIAAFTAAS